ncbi:hypothetical protein B0T25DRAFT_489625 [Lasiosphaeria hispida]|uniref:Rhodopsin domain-containing protein n=1 Tax=Lasiosphaeria hispida TaxID=260671 RepID=A0AAJ0H566_9PEZI|nr:hypothetical protein B0T25DRAFT_489625 [Lasiosphaeria hispida]
MADADESVLPPPAPPPGTSAGRGPLGMPGGQDRSYQVDIMVCAVITAVIGTVFVALRFYTRRVIINVLGWEDWLILAAQIFTIAMCGGFIHEAVLGHGQHSWLVPVENLGPLNKTGWYTIFFYELSRCCAQISITMLYIRIWNVPWARRAAYALLAVVVIYNVLTIVMVLTACVPLAAFWDFELLSRGAYCHNKSMWWAKTYLQVIVDFLIYLLPMPVIIRVKFQTRQKVLLFVLFAMGFFICALSLVRVYILKITANSVDFHFDNIPTALWSCIETNATVVVACNMTMKPLLAKWFPNLMAPGGDGNEQNRQGDAGVADLSGRVPTIGSGPSRPIVGQQQPWMFVGVGGDDEREKSSSKSVSIKF